MLSYLPGRQACQVSRIARVRHAIGSFHMLTRKPGLLSRIFVHAWNQDMASSFTSIKAGFFSRDVVLGGIRDRRIKMPCVLGHYLLYNSSSTARFVGRENVKNILKTNESCYCLGGEIQNLGEGIFLPKGSVKKHCIRDRRIKMPCVLGHYLLYNSSSTARCGPTSVMVHAV